MRKMKQPNETRGRRRDANAAGITERRYKAFELRKAGASYRLIAITMKNLANTNPKLYVPPKYNFTEAYKDVEIVLKELRPVQEDIEQYRNIQIERLENYLVRINPLIQAGDLTAIEKAIRIDNRLALLKGTDQPIKVDIPQEINFIWSVEGEKKKSK
jgi:hypothetical protein